MKEKYQIDLSYACAGIILSHGVVVEAAPIFKWMVGKCESTVREWVTNKHGKITFVGVGI